MLISQYACVREYFGNIGMISKIDLLNKSTNIFCKKSRKAFVLDLAVWGVCTLVRNTKDLHYISNCY